MKKTILIIVGSLLVVGLAAGGIYFWQRDALEQKEKMILEKEKSIEKPKTQGKINILYRKDNDLILYNTVDRSKKTIFSSPDLIDFDLSFDQKLVAYSLKETGFEGNSDIFLLNLGSGKITRLTEKNEIASLNPKITADNKKVLYIRRTKNKDYPQYLDDAIWAIDSDGNPNSSKEIVKTFLDYKGFLTPQEVTYCFTEDDLRNTKTTWHVPHSSDSFVHISRPVVAMAL